MEVEKRGELKRSLDQEGKEAIWLFKKIPADSRLGRKGGCQEEKVPTRKDVKEKRKKSGRILRAKNLGSKKTNGKKG